MSEKTLEEKYLDRIHQLKGQRTLLMQALYEIADEDTFFGIPVVDEVRGERFVYQIEDKFVPGDS